MSTQVVLHNGEYAAVVDDRGATLRSLRWRGIEMLATPGSYDPRLGHHGAVLAPWPGRVGGAEYSFVGEQHRLAVNEPSLGHAIHGLVFDRLWRRDREAPSCASWTTAIVDEPGYPFAVALTVEYAVSAERGLTCTATWRNTGSRLAPLGIGFHPYFRGALSVDATVLQVPARIALDGDPHNKLPLEARGVDAERDYASPRRIGDEVFSRTYGGLTRNADGVAEVSASFGDTALHMRLSEAFRWIQVFTGDVPDPEMRRRGLALEPQTCPPNAFASGHDLLTPEPDAVGSAWWSVSFDSGLTPERRTNRDPEGQS
ncbi:hypothetical protein [Microbacterium sp. A93]|uniref:aldose epimerase family protein n=1 Tax=Microbacterium sp. A93 TaxID=3450716 RepID=UPI003F43789C